MVASSSASIAMLIRGIQFWGHWRVTAYGCSLLRQIAVTRTVQRGLRTARIYQASRRLFDSALVGVRALFTGVWLGLLDRTALHAADELYYSRLRMYQDDAHNLSGLRDWEVEALDNELSECRSLIVTAAGAGREVVALRQRGIDVFAFECHPELVRTGNDLLQRQRMDAQIVLAPRDVCPDQMPNADGIIVGWGSYMLIPHSSRRIRFLRQLRQRVSPGAPILLSFFERTDATRYLRLTTTIANVIRAITRQEKVELGDDLVPNYVHRFTQDEIATELQAAGFTLVRYSSAGYPHALARASSTPGSR
jgi:hypothetical protein